MHFETSTTQTTSVAATVAPEDLHCGDYVAVLNETFEWPSFLCGDASLVTTDETGCVRCQFKGDGRPLKVKAICLPFVFVKPPHGASFTLDVRSTQFVRLQVEYAKTVRKQLRKDAKQSTSADCPLCG